MISIVFCIINVFSINVFVRFLLLKRLKKMKRFKLLGALFVWLIWLVSFWYCWTITTYLKWQTITHDWSNNNIIFACTNVLTTASSDVQSSFSVTYSFDSFNVNWTVFLLCANYSQYNWSLMDISSMWIWNKFSQNLTYTFTKSQSNKWVGYCCLQINWYNVTNLTYWDYSVTFDTNNVPAPDCPVCEEQYTSEECQQEYSLMPISSCNSEYCWLNWLCPEYTGSTMSELYINWINHLWAPIININIPLEQARDYEYTWDTMNINLSWENNVDYEYMDNIIRTQNSKPNTVDFNNIISVLLPKFIPWLVIILFILFIFRFIKKIF